jgi:putative transposase
VKKVAEATIGIKNAIQVNEEEVKAHLGELVRQSVEETINGLLDAEADRLCQAKRYERKETRADTRAGHYTRDLQTQAGKVALKVPKLRNLPFETQIIERYRRRESSVEEALLEMYLRRGLDAPDRGHHRCPLG